MQRQDWEEYFQAVNGRSATDEEAEAAREKGEYTDELTPPENTFTSEPEESSSAQALSASFCIQCGKALEPGSAFCGDCGAPVTGINVPAPAMSVQPSFAQNEQYMAGRNRLNDLWEWARSSLKAPFTGVKENDETWFGVVTIILTSIFGALIPTTVAWKAVSQASSSVRNFLGSFGLGSLASLLNNGLGSVTSTSNQLITSLFFTLCLGMAAIHFSVVLGGLLVRRLVYSDTTFTFQQAMNQYGRLYVPLLALILLAEFFALVGVNSLVVFLSYASYMMFSVIFTFEILHTRVMRSGDTFYLMLAGSILAGATMLIGVLIAVLFSGGQLASFASSLF